jgi:hypothetical protein
MNYVALNQPWRVIKAELHVQPGLLTISLKRFCDSSIP